MLLRQGQIDFIGVHDSGEKYSALHTAWRSLVEILFNTMYHIELMFINKTYKNLLYFSEANVIKNITVKGILTPTALAF